MNYHHFFYKTLGSLLIILGACGSNKESDKTPKLDTITQTQVASNELFVSKTQFKASSMEFGTIRSYSFDKKIMVNGKLDIPPQQKSKVSPYFPGYVKEVFLLEGQKVNQGQVLLTLENPTYVQIQEDFLMARAKLSTLKANYERQKKLVENQATSQKKFLQTTSDYELAQIHYQSLRKKLLLMNLAPDQLSPKQISSTISLYAPMSGYITGVHITKGEYLSPTTPAMEITNVNHLHLELAVFEKDVALLKEGQNITFSISGNPDVQHQAKIYLIGKSIAMDKRQVSVHAHLENLDHSQTFLPGMFAQAYVVLKSHKSKGVPSAAVISSEDKNFILIKTKQSKNGYFLTKREVKTGQKYQGFIEIISPQIKPSEQILIKGSFVM